MEVGLGGRMRTEFIISQAHRVLHDSVQSQPWGCRGDPRSSHKASQPRAVCIFSQVVPAVDTWCVCLGWRVRGRFAGIR